MEVRQNRGSSPEMPHVAGAPWVQRKDMYGDTVYTHTRPKSVRPPDGWQARTPHPTKSGHVVYWIWLPLIGAVVAAIVCLG
jgi:hypothetical protein